MNEEETPITPPKKKKKSWRDLY